MNAPDQKNNPKIGSDEWVDQVDQRQRQRSPLARGWAAIPQPIRYAGVVALLMIFPLITAQPFFLQWIGLTSNEFIIRIGAQFLISALLAIGLNVVVGYAGLLDLGYVAFYGVAGYLYAYLSSGFVTAGGLNGIHLPTIISLPVIVAITMLVGWGLGSVSMRLIGDYLAIVTLGFGQIFVQLLLSATRVEVPWSAKPVDLTRGPNGINDLDPLAFFGFTFDSTLQYYYLFLAVLVLVYIAIDHINRSRIGRGWRAMREDALAAEVMGMPTRRLKLQAFAIGAGIAAIAGVIDAGWQGSVVPRPRYDVVTLINLYAMIVLGGIGSLPGAVIGAAIFTTLPELLRSPTLAGWFFYGVGLLGLLAWLKPSLRFVVVLGGTTLAGLVLNFVLAGLDVGKAPPGSALNRLVQQWLVIPKEFETVGNLAIGAALLLTLLVVIIKGPVRWWLLGLTIYVFVFAWETRLAAEPSATRILIIGVALVLLMIFRPTGLLGKTEIKIV